MSHTCHTLLSSLAPCILYVFVSENPVQRSERSVSAFGAVLLCTTLEIPPDLHVWHHWKVWSTPLFIPNSQRPAGQGVQCPLVLWVRVRITQCMKHRNSFVCSWRISLKKPFLFNQRQQGQNRVYCNLSDNRGQKMMLEMVNTTACTAVTSD